MAQACPHCGYPISGMSGAPSQQAAVPDPVAESWQCTRCSKINVKSDQYCASCGVARHEMDPVAQNPGGQSAPQPSSKPNKGCQILLLIFLMSIFLGFLMIAITKHEEPVNPAIELSAVDRRSLVAEWNRNLQKERLPVTVSTSGQWDTTIRFDVNTDGQSQSPLESEAYLLGMSSGDMLLSQLRAHGFTLVIFSDKNGHKTFRNL